MSSNKNFPDTADAGDSVCPVSGLKITAKPEWSDIKLSENHHVSFWFIGDRILYIKPRGLPEPDSIKELFRQKTKVLEAVLGSGEKYLELRDLARVRDNSTIAVRKQMVEGLQADQDRMLGLVACHAPVGIKLSWNVGKRLYRFPAPISVVRTYQDAIRRALAILTKSGFGLEKAVFSWGEKKEWPGRTAEEGRVTYQVINGNIIYGETFGEPYEKDIIASLNLMWELAASLANRGIEYYLLVKPKRSRLTRKTRNYYIDFLNRLYLQHPFQAYVLCQPNRFFTTVFYLTRPRLKFPAHMVYDFENALALINRLEASADKTEAFLSAPAPSTGISGPQAVEELLHYLGSINWESEDFSEFPEKSGDDPLKPVYNAIDLIKADVDDLLLKREQDRQELQENIERQKEIIESLDDGYYECDLAGNTTQVNRAMCEMYGYPKGEFIGLNYRAYMDEQTAREIFQAFNRVYKTGQPNRGLEVEIVRKDGSRRCMEISATLIRDSEGSPAGFRGIVRDVTQRRQDEEQLEMFRRFIESSGEGVGWSDLDGRIVYVNPTMCRILGEDGLESVRGNYVTGYYDDDTRRRMFTEIVPKVNRSQEWKGELTVRNRLGRRIPTLNDIFVIRDKSGGIRYHAIIMRDISDLKNTEQALRESEEKYRLLINNASDAICIAQDGVLKFVNPKVVALVQYTQEELLKRAFTDLVDPEDVPAMMERYQKRLNGEKLTGPSSFRIYTKSGHMLWVQNNSVRINWEGRPAVLNFIRDITLQKKMEEQLRQTMKMEAIGTLAGGIAHDFNNILATIMGYTEVVLGETASGSRSQRNLKQVRRAVMRGRELVRQILTFSRPAEENFKPLAISSVVKEVLKMLQSTAPANIEINRQIAENGATVMADPIHIHEILMNLCTNAIQAMENGGTLTIELSEVDLDVGQTSHYQNVEPGRFVRLGVRDTGKGMSPEDGYRIFEPYYTTRPHENGTGLGLSMVHGIVDNLGGFITVDSQPGGGTLFCVYLPAAGAESSDWEAVSIEESRLQGKERIFLIDQDRQLIDSGQQMLEQLGYSVETSADAEKALEIVRARAAAFDLVIVDLFMLKIGGDQLAREFFSIRPELPIILCAGDDTAMSDVSETMIRHCLSKPFFARDLARAVRGVLDKV